MSLLLYLWIDIGQDHRIQMFWPSLHLQNRLLLRSFMFLLLLPQRRRLFLHRSRRNADPHHEGTRKGTLCRHHKIQLISIQISSWNGKKVI